MKYLYNYAIFLVLIIIPFQLKCEISHFIQVDQFGYSVNAIKTAVISNPEIGYDAELSYNPPITLQLVRASDNTVVYEAALSVWNSGQVHEHSGNSGWWFDFTEYNISGEYYIFDKVNNEKSAIFEISDNPYKSVLIAAGRMFFYQRCNCKKDAVYADDKWSDEISFMNTLQDSHCRYIYEPENSQMEKDLSGGWFDAGDYNKYVTFSYSALHNLLSAYEESPEVFLDNWNIPESGNEIPDIIDEIVWELNWILKMVNPDGSVHIKMGSKNYVENSLSPPSANTDQRYYGNTCTSASITVASVFAHSAIVLSKFDELTEFAEILKSKAELCFDYALVFADNSSLEEDCDDISIVSGDADSDTADQITRLINAAVYLYGITGDSKYDTVIKKYIYQTELMESGYWDPYSRQLQDALLLYTKLSNADESLKNDILNSASQSVNDNWNDYFGFNELDLYRVSVPDWAYHWNSNQYIAEFGIMNYALANYGIGNTQSLKKKSSELTHYFHGVNPNNIVYLSNMYSYGADKCVNEFYHSWFADGTDYDNVFTSAIGPAPGYLVGGANVYYTVNDIVPPASQPHQKSYKDWNSNWPDKSWEITEAGIYTQAAYIRLLSKYVKVESGSAVSEPKNNDIKLNYISNDLLAIQIINNSNFKSNKISIFDYLGNNVLSINIENISNQYKINISTLTNGIYYLKFNNFVRPFIVCR